MTNQPSDNYLFKDSKYDFDKVLEEMGYTISGETESQVIFTKAINPHTELSLNGVQPDNGSFLLRVTRNKQLWKHGRYDICSPYAVAFMFEVKPLIMCRRFMWDTFSGDNADILRGALGQIEGEAESILTMLIQVDNDILKKMGYNTTFKPENQ